MARDDNTRFRITTWPSSPVPLPTGQALAGEVFASDVVGWLVEVPGPSDGMAFGEVYLQLYDLDLDDSKAILAFVERYSALTIRSYAWGEGVYGHYLGFPGLPTWAATVERVQEDYASNDPSVETEGE